MNQSYENLNDRYLYDPYTINAEKYLEFERNVREEGKEFRGRNVREEGKEFRAPNLDSIIDISYEYR